MKKMFALIFLLAVLGTAKAQNLDVSYNPPGGLTPAQCPVFVVLGWDDNSNAGYSKPDPQGTKWILDYIRNLKNPAGTGNPATYDGSAARCSFYINSMYGEGYFSSEDPVNNKRSWHQALIDGHEIGNHTRAHLEGAGSWTAQQWDTAISKCSDFLAQPWDANEKPGNVDSTKGIGIAKNNIYGFRSPFLVYNQLVFETVKKNGLVYDCSHEHLITDAQDGTSQTNSWPYTLHAGTHGTPKLNVSIDSLWEIPVYELQIPTSVSGNSTVTSITGFDYNLISDTVKKYTKEQMFEIFKFNLDQRIAGNHAPLTIGCHPDFYTSDYDQVLIDENIKVSTKYTDRQWAFEEFIKYALTKSEVRIVRGIDVINWMKNPVALGQVITGTFNLTVTADAGGTVSVDPVKTFYNAGDVVTVTAIPEKGKEFAAWIGGAVGNTNSLTVTIYQNLVITATFQEKTTATDCFNPLDLSALDEFFGLADALSSVPASPKATAGVLTIPWTLAKMSKPEAWDTYLEIDAAIDPNANGAASIYFWYKSDQDFLVELPSSDVKDYANHEKSLPTTTTWTEMNIPISQFNQPSWPHTAVILDLNKVSTLNFLPAGDPTNTAISGTLELKNVKVCRIDTTIGINKTATINNAITMYAYNQSLFIQSNKNDIYTLSLYSIDGKLVSTRNINLIKGQNTFALNTTISNSIYLIKLQNANDMHIQKVLIK